MYERYSIEANDESVMIYGDLSIEEAFDFLSFFERKGFKSLTLGSDNSTMSFRRKSIDQVQEDVRKVEHAESEKFYENLYSNHLENSKKIVKRNEELEQLIKEIMTDKSERVKHLEKTNQELLKRIQLKQLEDDEEVKKLLLGFAYRPPKPDEDPEKIHVLSATDVMISPTMTREEKEKAYKNLMQIKRDPNCPQVPDWEEFVREQKESKEDKDV